MNESTIYKLVDSQEWEQACQQGRFKGAPVDLADGYIHFSTASQLPETAAKHFLGATNITLVAVATLPLGNNLTYEVSRNNDLFPHHYGDLPTTAAIWAVNYCCVCIQSVDELSPCEHIPAPEWDVNPR